jgi:hypothetical protein
MNRGSVGNLFRSHEERKSVHVPAITVRDVSRRWVGRLSHFRHHRNDEHREALVDEALRYAGLRLESELVSSEFWSEASLDRRATLLLFLLDRGLVTRIVRDGRVVFEVADDAEAWLFARSALSPYVIPTLELLSALRLARG